MIIKADEVEYFMNALADNSEFVWLRLSTGELFVCLADRAWFDHMLAIHGDVGSPYDFDFIGAL